MTKIIGLVAAAAMSFAAGAAQADVISAVTSASALGANDSVTWDQLGTDGTTIPASFTAIAKGGSTVGGSFANGTGTVCASCTTGTTADTSIFSSNGAAGTGPITLTFAGGVSALGTTVLNGAALQNYDTIDPIPFTATLSLYNGSTLLGTVSGTSDAGADAFYLGAVDSSGSHITSATFAVTSIGVAAQSTYSLSYNYNDGHVDPAAFCKTVSQAALQTSLSAQLMCPQSTKPYNIFPEVVSASDFNSATQNGTANLANIGVQETSTVSTVDTTPSDLAELYIDTVNLADTLSAPPATVPEPGSLAVFCAGAVGLLGFRRRRKLPGRAMS